MVITKAQVRGHCHIVHGYPVAALGNRGTTLIDTSDRRKHCIEKKLHYRNASERENHAYTPEISSTYRKAVKRASDLCLPVLL